MRKTRLFTVLLLVAALLALAACARKSEQRASTPVTIDQVRKQAALAFDGTISSAQRRSAADEAMRLLLALLATPDAAAISDQEWAKSPRPGVEVMVRHVPLDGGVHLYTLSLPGTTLVDRRERLALQVRKAGSDPQVSELALMPDSTMRAARSARVGSTQMLTLAMDLKNGSGYVAHFESAGGGAFKRATGAFSGLAGNYGSLTLESKDGYLLVTSQAGPAGWQPAFDQQQPLRLLLGPDLTLDWKQRFILMDDSKFDAFSLLAIAHSLSPCMRPGDCPESLAEQAKKSPQDAAKAAWGQATAKVTMLLQGEKSFTDEFTGKLPEGSRSLREQGRNLSVRLLSIPAPEGVTPGAYTAVQFRTTGGIPNTRTVALPGLVESYRVMEYGGGPALFMVVDQTRDPKSSVRTKGLRLLRLNGSNDWVPAENWIGSIPNAPHWNLAADANSVAVEWESAKFPNMSVSLEASDAPAVSVCRYPTDCHKLTWVGGKLHALGILSAQLTEATQALSADQLVWRTAQLAEFLAGVDPVQVPAAQLVRLLDPNQTLKMEVLSAGSGVQLITMPANPTGTRTAVLYAKDQALVVQAHDGAVMKWEGAQIVQGGNEQRLLILGRSAKGATLIVYRLDGSKWVLTDALPTKVDQILQASVRMVNNPGQTRPVQGLMLFGGSQLTARLTAGGAEFCENQVACVIYGYNKGWTIQPK